MFRFPLSASLKLTTALTAAGVVSMAMPVWANPQNGQVVSGNATITTPDATTTQIKQSSQNAVINWGSFSIDPNETTRFVQPNADAWALNRVVGSQDPSVIAGTLEANGNIAIVNPDGILFSQGARVDVGGLVATTADISNDDFMSGNLSFNLPGNPSASIVNEGNITIADHGLAAFVAPGVRNSGVITAQFGSVSLAAGNTFALDLYGDGLVSLAIGDEIAADVYDVATGERVSDLVKNEGTISANGGTVALSAATARSAVNSVINNTGVIEVNTVEMRNGKIVLGGQTASASAPRQTVRVSGTVRATTPTVSVRPQQRPGAGGTIEITGEDIQIAGATIDASGANGGGKVLIGGDYLGGRTVSELFPLGEKIREDYDIATASTLTVDDDTSINASATEDGDGGTVILWSDEATSTSADIFALGAGDGQGGFIETSGQDLSIGEATIAAGEGGTWLLDPEFIVIEDSASGTGEQTILTSTFENALNNNSTVMYAATGPNARIWVLDDVIKTSNIETTLTLSSDNQIYIAGDLKSNDGELNVNLLADPAGSGNNRIDDGQLVLDGATIDTSGGNFRFDGKSFDFNPSFGMAGRVLTQGGTATFLTTGTSYAGCDLGASCFGSGEFGVDTGSGDIVFGVSVKTDGTEDPHFRRVRTDDFAFKTTGTVFVQNARVIDRNGTRNNGNWKVLSHEVVATGTGEFRFTEADAPDTSIAPTAASSLDYPIPDGAMNFGIALPTLFTSDFDFTFGTVNPLPPGVVFNGDMENPGLIVTHLGFPSSQALTFRATTAFGATTDLTIPIVFEAGAPDTPDTPTEVVLPQTLLEPQRQLTSTTSVLASTINGRTPISRWLSEGVNSVEFESAVSTLEKLANPTPLSFDNFPMATVGQIELFEGVTIFEYLRQRSIKRQIDEDQFEINRSITGISELVNRTPQIRNRPEVQNLEIASNFLRQRREQTDYSDLVDNDSVLERAKNLAEFGVAISGNIATYVGLDLKAQRVAQINSRQINLDQVLQVSKISSNLEDLVDGKEISDLVSTFSRQDASDTFDAFTDIYAKYGDIIDSLEELGAKPGAFVGTKGFADFLSALSKLKAAQQNLDIVQALVSYDPDRVFEEFGMRKEIFNALIFTKFFQGVTSINEVLDKIINETTVSKLVPNKRLRAAISGTVKFSSALADGASSELESYFKTVYDLDKQTIKQYRQNSEILLKAANSARLNLSSSNF